MDITRRGIGQEFKFGDYKTTTNGQNQCGLGFSNILTYKKKIQGI
jgi:hypothetical protein